MATVVIFVLVMSCIVLWVTTSLIQEEQGETSLTTPTGPKASITPVLPTITPTDLPTYLPTDTQQPGLK